MTGNEFWACLGLHTLAQRAAVMGTDYPASEAASVASFPAVHPAHNRLAASAPERQHDTSMTVGIASWIGIVAETELEAAICRYLDNRHSWPCPAPHPPSIIPYRRVSHLCGWCPATPQWRHIVHMAPAHSPSKTDAISAPARCRGCQGRGKPGHGPIDPDKAPKPRTAGGCL